MPETPVTTTPADLGTALGATLGARGFLTVSVQNAGPAAVYRTRSADAPVLGTVRGWRHAPGDKFSLILVGDADGAAGLWVWTATGTATLVIEPE